MPMTVGFSSETMISRRKPRNIFQELNKKNHQLRIQYLVKTSFRNKGEIKTLSDEGKLREFFFFFFANNSTLKEWQRKFSKQKVNDKMRNLGTSGRKIKYRKCKKWVNTVDFPDPLEFSKFV